ncbi:PKD domain-containing protein [Chloroflexota bacterium]
MTNYITVTIAPSVAAFIGDTTLGAAPLTVNFTDQSTESITSRSWSFGDGGTSTEQNPSHQYTTADTYTVSLTVTGPGGTDAETKTDYITVNPGALDHVTLTPDYVFIQTSAQQQFSAVAYDQYNNPISGLSYGWSVVNGGGTIDGNGLFTAGGARGTFLSTVQVEVSDNGTTKQDTATVAIGAAMTGTVEL